MSVLEKLRRMTGWPAADPHFGPDPDMLPDQSRSSPRDLFETRAAALGANAHVLEVGTKRSVPAQATHAQRLFPNVPRSHYVMADVEHGLDVDIVADLHGLPAEWAERFDAFVAVAVFEHLERPWLAAKEVARILKPGGTCYICTHQTFPLHGYPSDFFRFSREALTLLFEDAGLRTVDAAYENRAMITPPRTIITRPHRLSWNEKWPSYIHVHLLGEKA